MKKLGLLLICFLAASCSIPVSINVVNNSGIDLILLIKDRSIKIGDGKSEYIEGVDYSKLSIVSESNRHDYLIQDISTSDVEWRGWGPFSKRVFYLQIEPDGKIWMSKSGRPVTNLGRQPEGFPLEPKY